MTLNCTNINLKQGSKGAQVTELQQGLKKLGYYKPSVDGNFGPVTHNAVRAFQRATGHSDDGVFGPKTCPDFNKKLQVITETSDKTKNFNCPMVNLYKDIKGHTDEIKLLQTMLKKLGYYTSDVDGVFGPVTDNAVKAFQRATKHSDDGVFGPKTCPDLNKAYNAKITDETAKKNAKTTTTTTKKVDPYAFNPDDYQFVDESIANFVLDGIRFVVESVTDTVSFEMQGWNATFLMNNMVLFSEKDLAPLEYDVVTHIDAPVFKKLRPIFSKIMHRCPVPVYSDLVEPGNYLVYFKREDAKGTMQKITIHLLRHDKGGT